MKTKPVRIHTLSTGVPGLDEVLGGGFPELSFNLIAGEPGAGKTTLVQQVVFANATVERPALYFTVLGEPTIKLLRYQQQMSFFDAGRVGREVRVLNLGDEMLSQDFEVVFERIVDEVERMHPGIVAVDSFRTVTEFATHGGLHLERFVQRLAVKLTSWEVTSFLIGEYEESEVRNPLFTIADGALWMCQAIDGNSVVRKLRVVKMRGQAAVPGLHTMRITGEGVQVFPRTLVRAKAVDPEAAGRRVGTGVPGLDAMMGGGIPVGDTWILAGATGTGKTTFAHRFIAAGADAGEAAVMVVFEEHVENFVVRALAHGLDIRALEQAGRLRLLYLRPLDLSPDEVLFEIRAAVEQTGATRVVIDSLSGFEVALAPTFRADFRESIYRVVMALTGGALTMMLTLETPGTTGNDLRFTPPTMSFVADDIVVGRHIEIAGRLRLVLGIVKMRGSAHSNDLIEYTVTESGIALGGPLSAYDGLLTGIPTLRPGPAGA